MNSKIYFVNAVHALGACEVDWMLVKSMDDACEVLGSL